MSSASKTTSSSKTLKPDASPWISSIGSLDGKRLARWSPAGLARYHSKGRWKLARHLSLLNRNLLELAFGRMRRLLVEMPPRYGKSEYISKYTPAWWEGTFPDDPIILTSYEAEFAAGWGAKARDVFKESAHEVFGLQLAKDSASHWTVKDHDGTMQTAGMGGALTGKGAKLFIIDDPIKNAEEAHSETIREKQWDWFLSTATTRLEPDARIIVMMTRWHEDDLIGRIKDRLVKQEGQQWHELKLPATCEDETRPEEQWLGRKQNTWRDRNGTSHGDLLWPERWSQVVVEGQMFEKGAYWWAAMYQQRPAPLEGGLFKRQHFRYFEWELGEEETWFVLHTPDGKKRVLASLCWRFATMDVAASIKQKADYTVIAVWAVTPDSDLLLLDLVRVKFEGPDQPKLVADMYAKWKMGYIAVEKAGYQLTLIQTLLRDGKPVRPAQGTDVDKQARALTPSARYEAGKVYHLAGAPFLVELENELLVFPNGKHDDMVDVVSYAAIELALANRPRIREL